MSITTLNYGVYRTGENGLETLPRILTPVSRYGAIGFVHGALENYQQAQAAPAYAIISALAEAGYPTHAGDYCSAAYQQSGNCNNWGNSDNISALAAAYTRLTSGMGAKSGKLFICGGSMGALGALNYAKSTTSTVGALALFIPVLDLNNLYQNYLTSYGPGIDIAYGLSTSVTHASCTWTTTSTTVTDASISSSQLNWYVSGTGIPVGTTVLSVNSGSSFVLSATPTAPGSAASLSFYPPIPSATLNASSPINYTASVFSSIPITLFTSDNDPVASTTAEAEAWASGYANITVTSIGSVGHSIPTSINPQSIVQFFDSNGGRS
jgi:hypothetical protein